MSAEAFHLRAVPLPDGDAPVEWWIADGVLRSEPVEGARELPGGWVAPGLVDAHVHLSFETHPVFQLAAGTPEVIGAQAGAQREMGVLAVRDMGSLPGVRLPAEQDGVRIIGSGPFLAPPGRFIPGLYQGTPAEQVVEAARQRVRDGYAWVKVIADFPGPDGNYLQPIVNYPPEVLRVLVDAVHELGGRVAAHVSGPFVAEVVATGVDSVEHGTMAAPEVVAEMARRGTAWTPTLVTVVPVLERFAAHVPPVAAVLDLMRETLPLAAELGVTLLAGTDESPHGSVGEEVALLRRFGVPAERALAAATSGARAYFGLPGLTAGAPGDIVTFAADPRDDPGVLCDPAAVMVAGKRVR